MALVRPGEAVADATATAPEAAAKGVAPASGGSCGRLELFVSSSSLAPLPPRRGSISHRDDIDRETCIRT